MTLRERIQKLCKINHTSLNQVETELGFGKGYLSKLDNSTPNVKKMEQVANHFGVSIDFLMGKTDKITCYVCGFSYNLLSDEARKEHEVFHQKFLKIKEKYPFFMPFSEASIEKTDRIFEFRNPQKTLEEKIDAFEKYLEAAFSLEICQNNYNIDHLDYEQFCKVEVGTLEPDYAISNEFIDALIEKHGVDKSYLSGNEQLLARVSNNSQLMRILKYAEMLNPKLLDALEIQTKALAEQSDKE